MTVKRIPFGVRPTADPAAETWVRQGNHESPAEAAKRTQINTARLTIDVTPQLRGRIKVLAFQQGITLAELVRGLLEREFPEGAA